MVRLTEHARVIDHVIQRDLRAHFVELFGWLAREVVLDHEVHIDIRVYLRELLGETFCDGKAVDVLIHAAQRGLLLDRLGNCASDVCDLAVEMVPLMLDLFWRENLLRMLLRILRGLWILRSH